MADTQANRNIDELNKKFGNKGGGSLGPTKLKTPGITKDLNYLAPIIRNETTALLNKINFIEEKYSVYDGISSSFSKELSGGSSDKPKTNFVDKIDKVIKDNPQGGYDDIKDQQNKVKIQLYQSLGNYTQSIEELESDSFTESDQQKLDMLIAEKKKTIVPWTMGGLNQKTDEDITAEAKSKLIQEILEVDMYRKKTKTYLESEDGKKLLEADQKDKFENFQKIDSEIDKESKLNKTDKKVIKNKIKRMQERGETENFLKENWKKIVWYRRTTEINKELSGFMKKWDDYIDGSVTFKKSTYGVVSTYKSGKCKIMLTQDRRDPSAMFLELRREKRVKGLIRDEDLTQFVSKILTDPILKNKTLKIQGSGVLDRIRLAKRLILAGKQVDMSHESVRYQKLWQNLHLELDEKYGMGHMLKIPFKSRKGNEMTTMKKKQVYENNPSVRINSNKKNAGQKLINKKDTKVELEKENDMVVKEEKEEKDSAPSHTMTK